MLLKQLTMCNFRQFYGDQRIEFASGDQKNVTIVFGANGAGKSTLLSAIIWCLYERMSPGVSEPERIINTRAWASAPLGGRVEASVKLVFSHDDGKTYEVHRIVEHEKTNGEPRVHKTGGRDDVKVWITERDGQSQLAGNPTDRINQLLPLELHNYFFFDGERIEGLVRQETNPQVEKKRAAAFADASRKLLGIEVLVRAAAHMEAVTVALRSEWSKAAPKEIQGDLERIEKEMAELQDAQEACQQELDNKLSNLRGLEEEKRAVDEDLRANAESAAIQRERDSVDRRLEEITESLEKAIARQKSIVTKYGMFAFMEGLVRTVDERYGAQRARGELPAKIKRQFVDDLLETGLCICGSSLHPGSDAWNKVNAWRHLAIAAEAEARWYQVHNAVANFEMARSDLFTQLKGVVEEIADYRRMKTEAHEKLAELGQRIGSLKEDEVRALGQRQHAVEQQITATNQDIGGCRQRLNRLQQEMIAAKDDYDKTSRRSTKANTAKERLDAAVGVAEVFAALLARETDFARSEVDRELKSVFRRILYKDYTPELTSEFQLQAFNNGQPVALSTGENQILSLSFVGAIVAFARAQLKGDQSHQRALSAFGGGTFPVVMDSPFGALDQNYRHDIAKAIPLLADQVVMMVSKSQGLGEVYDEVRNRTGRHYVLVYHSPKPDLVEESLELAGTRTPYIVRDAVEWAEIKEF